MDATIQDAATITPAGQTAPVQGTSSLVTAMGLALLAALPFAFVVRPQQADYPSHLARYHVMLNGKDGAFLEQFYAFEWALRGNLGIDLLMVPLGHLLGAENAAWLLALLLPPLLGIAIVVTEWTLRRRIGVGSLLALATIWSPAMAMGFANFSMSVALALLAFSGWVQLEGKRWRAALFVPVGLAVWLCHSAGWGVLGVLVFGYEWHVRRSLSALIAPWPLFPPFLMIAAEPGVGGSIHYGTGVAAYKLGIWVKGLAETSVTLDVLSVLALVAAILLAARARRIDGRIGWAALIAALLTLVMPRHFGGGDLADQRLVPIALMLSCLAIDARVPRWVLWCAPALFLVRLGATTAQWQDSSAKLEAALPALDYVPQGARIAAAIPYDDRRWGTAPLSHAASYAAVYRDALVNTHFALSGVHMLRVKGHGAAFADPSQRVAVRPGEGVDLSRFAPATQADYLWYVGANPVAKLPANARVVHRAPGSVLARLANPPAGR